MNRRLRMLVVVASIFAAIGVEAACSNQGEGEVCDVLNGSDDCKTDEGLVCYEFVQLTNTVSDRCCPLDRATATHPVCKTSTGVTDAAPPADTGPPTVAPDAQVSDATGATTDTGADAQQQP